MPTFNTPQSISVTVELGLGDLRVVASDRTDTVVVVRPRDPTNKADVTAAAQTRVEYADGRLSVKAPKGWRLSALRNGGESIDVQIELPEGSELRADTGVGAVRSSGRLGECHLKRGVGELQVDETDGPTKLVTGSGDIIVARVIGHADVTTGSGAVRIGSINGTAVVKNSNGDTWIGEVDGDLRANAANGKIVVERAHAAVVAKTANGDVRLAEVSAGAIVAETAVGKIDIGVRDGVAAWLDLNTRFGRVHNDLDAAEHPDSGDAVVEVRAHTSFGDVTVGHASQRVTGDRVS